MKVYQLFLFFRYLCPPPFVSINLKGSLHGLSDIFFGFSDDEAAETKLILDEFGHSIIRNLFITDNDNRKSFVQSIKVCLFIYL
jgi:hypothetical protein